MISSREEFIDYCKTHTINVNLNLENNFSEEFPYRVMVKGHYNPGQLDDYELWCFENFGYPHCSVCNFNWCEFDWDKWHEETGWGEILNQNLKKKLKGNEDGQEKSRIISEVINEHFERFEQDGINQPGDHGHKGIWTTVFLRKTSYDYGFQEFYFKYPEDQMQFILENT